MQLWPGEAPAPGVLMNALKPNAQNRWIHFIDRQGKYIIPYVLGGKFTMAEKSIIHGAMRAIAQNSCIRFRKRKGEQDFVEIQNRAGEGCYTMVGRMPGRNVVMLETNSFATCLLHETVIHELFHTIGLWHEQMRFDRDKFLKIHWDNIPKSFIPQFKKVPAFESTTYGVHYDYNSVMHYGKDAFAMLPGEITMETVDPSAEDRIGHAKDASSGDYTKICSIYNCPSCMGQPFKRGQQVKRTNRGGGRNRGNQRGRNRNRGGKRNNNRNKGKGKTGGGGGDDWISKIISEVENAFRAPVAEQTEQQQVEAVTEDPKHE